ncbi:hypothetical protein GGI43DRAFT_203550 [Trichoderma evansii]
MVASILDFAVIVFDLILPQLLPHASMFYFPSMSVFRIQIFGMVIVPIVFGLAMRVAVGVISLGTSTDHLIALLLILSWERIGQRMLSWSLGLPILT